MFNECLKVEAQNHTDRRFYTQKRLQTELFAHQSFYIEAFSHKRFFTRRRIHTQKHLHPAAFTHRVVCPQKVLHIEAFHRSIYTQQMALHTKGHKSVLTCVYPCKCRVVYTQSQWRLHTNGFYAQKRLHTELLTHSSAHTHTDVLEHRGFYIQKQLRTENAQETKENERQLKAYALCQDTK